MKKTVVIIEVIAPNILHLTEQQFREELLKAEIRMNSDSLLRFHLIETKTVKK